MFMFLEEFFKDLKRREEEANKRILPYQKEIGYGDYFIRLLDTGMEGILKIYGRIMTREESVGAEKELGAGEAELQHTAARLDSSYARGYRYSWCYSEVEPEGELGFVHVSVMAGKISREQFENAKANGWR